MSSRNWLHYIALGGLISVLCASSPVLAQDEQNPRPQADGQSSADQRGSEALPVVVKVEGAPTREEYAARQAADESKRDRNEAVTRKIGVAAVIASVIQALILIWQIIYLKGTLTQMRKSEERQLRAYVFAERADIENAEPDLFEAVMRPLAPAITLTVKNSGQTPAYELQHWAQMSIKHPDEEWSLIPPSDALLSHKAFISPGGQISKTVPIDPTATSGDWSDLLSGSKRLYVFGTIRYRDAFKVVRTTKYRLFYHGSMPPGIDGQLMFCLDGNESD